jgi:hypothetical protein
LQVGKQPTNLLSAFMRHSRIQNTEEDGRVAFDDGPIVEMI